MRYATSIGTFPRMSKGTPLSEVVKNDNKKVRMQHISSPSASKFGYVASKYIFSLDAVIRNVY